MEFTSRDWTLEELLKEALKDKEYYKAFGGGVTASGGDPMLQYGFLKEFFRELKNHGIHTALDTCGLIQRETISSILPYTDLVLYDLKFIDDALHKKYTGSSNKMILKNLIEIAGELKKYTQGNRSDEKKLWIRTPLIPGATATSENLGAISSFIHENIEEVVERWELCTFNSACISKYEKLDQDWEFKNTKTIKQKIVDDLKEAALSSGFEEEKLITSGMIAK
jgi:pyruvate formate lyase activating enzyme